MEESVKTFIQQCAQESRNSIARNRHHHPNLEQVEAAINEWERILLEERIPTDEQLQNLQQYIYGEATSLIIQVINNPRKKWDKTIPAQWPISHPFVRAIFQPKWFVAIQNLAWSFRQFMTDLFESSVNVDDTAKLIRAQGFTDAQIIEMVCINSNNAFYAAYPQRNGPANESPVEKVISPFGRYLLPLLPSKKGFLGLGKEEGFKKYIDEIFSKDNYVAERRIFWVSYLIDYCPEGLADDPYEYLWKKDYHIPRKLDFQILHLFLDEDPVKYESLANRALDEYSALPEHRFSVYLKLAKVVPDKYDQLIRALGEFHLHYFTQVPAKDHYYHNANTHGQGYLANAYSNYLLSIDPVKGKERIEQFIADAVFLTPSYLRFLEEKFKVESVPMLLTGLTKDYAHVPSNEKEYYRHIISLLSRYDLREHIDALITFSINNGDKKSRIALAKVLASYPDLIIPKAADLLNGKTVDERVTGALLLSVISTEQVKEILNGAVDRETNDDTRDIILEALNDQRFAESWSKEKVRQMITRADARKKLSKWTEKFVAEDKLPALYWKDSPEKLNEKEVRFLFYRMKRSRGMNSDSEAKQLIIHLDTDRTASFAKFLVAAFQESNADSKLKYYLTLGGLLGDDDMMHNLHMLFKKSVADKRVRMAEYVIGALAMIGSNRALRIVESIFRKYANKKPTLSEAAKEALTAAATELNISMDELGDRIIPDFDFDGLYKSIDVEGETLRAFVNEEFKINYFNEDNKLRKSLPATASKELKTELKEIEKEINDVIKTQPGRLEKCMLDERRWEVEQWRNYFLQHPIMFVYAMKLLWGEYDSFGKLIQAFQVTQDTTLINSHDEEIEISEGNKIGIVHPIHLTEEPREAWKDKFYQGNITTLFPILDREVFTIADETDPNGSSSKRFFEKAVPKGADFVNTFLVKQNWLKSSGDGGRSEFTKIFNEGLKAYAHIDGPAAYYQNGTAPATVFEISFMGKNWSDKVLIKDIPAVFYSEVMADIDKMIKAT